MGFALSLKTPRLTRGWFFLVFTFATGPGRWPSGLAPCSRQRLVPSSRGANILQCGPGSRSPGWCPAAGKGLFFRQGAPTFCHGSRAAGVWVGALQPAKACSFVERRQHFAMGPGQRESELAPSSRQRLVPSSRGANILPCGLGAGKFGKVKPIFVRR